MANVPASELSKCGEEVPLLGVTREFDFGQFIELFDETSDPLNLTRPILSRIVIQPSATLASDRDAATSSQAATASYSPKLLPRNSAIVPPTPAPLQASTGELEVHLFDLIDHGPGAKLTPISVEVKDAETFFKEGSVEVGGKTYKVSLEDFSRDAMSMGLPFNTFAEPSKGGAKIPLRISVPFEPLKLTKAGLSQILSGNSIEGGGFAGAKPVLTRGAIRSLLAGTPVMTHVLGPKGRKTPIALVPPKADLAPMGERFQVFDLPSFIANPVITAKDGSLIPLDLTAENVSQMISTGRTQLNLGGPIELTVVDDEKSADLAAYINAIDFVQDAYGTLVPVKAVGTSWDEIIQLAKKFEKDPHFVHPLIPDGDSGLGPHRGGETVQTGGPNTGQAAPAKSMTDKVQPRLPTGTGLPVAVFVPWKQTWTLKGFSRGNLLNTIALAPQEEITMQVFSWERKSRTLEQSTETDISQETDLTSTTRDTEDVFREMLAKRDFAWQLSGSLDASYSPGVASIKVHAGGGVEDTQSIQQTARNSTQSVKESTIKAASRVSSRRVTRVTQSIESGREERVTRVIRNPNMCHTLTLDFFETLAHYEIKLEFVKERLRLVVLLQNPIKTPVFESEIIRRNETALFNALIETALVDGFDGCRLVAAYDEAKKIIERQKLEADKVDDIGAQRDQTVPPTPSGPPDPAAPQQAEVERIVSEMVKTLKDIHDHAEIDTALTAIGAQPHVPVTEAARRSGQQWLFINFLASKFPAILAVLDDLAKGGTPPMIAAQRILAVLPRPDAPTNLSNLNQMSAGDKESACLASKLKEERNGQRLYQKMEWDWTWWSNRLQQESLYTSNDGGLNGFADQLQKAYQAWEAKKAQGDAMKDQDVAKTEAVGQQEKADTNDKLSTAFPLEDLARAYERMKILKDHLNEHREYYDYVLFQALPPSEQAMRIVEASNGKLQVGLFEPRVVAMSGSRLVVPLTPLAGSQALQDFVKSLGTNLAADFAGTAATPDSTILPTPGVSVSSRLGKCSGCEDYIEDARKYELKRLSAVADQEQREADRRQARLDADDFENFHSLPAAVKVTPEGPA